MASINIFEGSRRIGWVVRILFTLVVAYTVYDDTPLISLQYVSVSPVSPLSLTSTDDCRPGVDAMQFVTRSVDGMDANVSLCFQAQDFDAQQLLVPYKQEEGQQWGSTAYDAEVIAYTEGRAGQFQLDDAGVAAATSAWRDQRRQSMRDGVLVLLAGWLGLWLVQTVIGWIARGFLGIPRGMDRLPDLEAAPAPQQQP